MDTDAIEDQDEKNGTGTGENSSHNQDKTFTQDEVNKLVEGRLAKEKQHQEEKYSGIDLDLYKQLVEEKENREEEEQKKRGEFDELLNKKLSKKDEAIAEREQTIAEQAKVIEKFKIDDAMLKEANDFNFHDPAEVVELNRKYVRLNDQGEREIIDADGEVRLNDKGELFTLKDLYTEYASKKKHQVKSTGPGGSGINPNGAPNSSKPGKFIINGREFDDPGIKPTKL